VACCLASAGCHHVGAVRVDPPRGHASSTGCSALLQALPTTLMGQVSRPVSPDDSMAAAWGDPAIVLRCGVPPPPSLKPTSRCDVVDGVGWFSRQDEVHDWIFTTIGRTTNVELRVPSDYTPAADALVDVAGAVKDELPVSQPCV
jgi:hypothetical protein